jgi:membrane protein required for colicin V production
MLTSFDYTLLIILGSSVLLSLMRGFVKEAMSLLAWVVSFVLARTFTPDLAPLLPSDIPSEGLRLVAAFLGIFLASWLMMTIIRITLSQFVEAIGLGSLDKLLGALFGALRGGLIVMVLVMLAGLTSLPQQDFWRNAMFSPLCEALALGLRDSLPEPMAKRIQFVTPQALPAGTVLPPAESSVTP